MFNKFELIGGAISILSMATALYLVQAQTNLAMSSINQTQLAAVVESDNVVVPSGNDS